MSRLPCVVGGEHGGVDHVVRVEAPQLGPGARVEAVHVRVLQPVYELSESTSGDIKRPAGAAQAWNRALQMRARGPPSRITPKHATLHSDNKCFDGFAEKMPPSAATAPTSEPT